MSPQPLMHDATFVDHARDVYGWAYRILGRHHDAMDVVQDVFLRWRRHAQAAKPRAPRGWLRTVTINRSIDVRRSETVRRSSTLDRQSIGVDGAPDTMALDRAQLRDDVRRAMAALSDIQRGILVAKVFDAMTFAEIADETGRSLSTVKTHYLRAVRAMRQQLEIRWRPEERNGH